MSQLFELKLLEKGLAKTYMLQNDYKYASELKTAERKAKMVHIIQNGHKNTAFF